MSFEAWFTLVGLLFIGMALSRTLLDRLPLSTSMLYLGLGVLLALFAGVDLDPLRYSEFLERVTEIVVIISLFTAGLKLRTPFSDDRWRLPVRLALISMSVTIALVTVVGVVGLGLPLGAAVLLGAVLAPTDPVLASDVQVEHPSDRDRLRFSLTGEAGLNDGAAFPFVMLGLGLLGLHELGEWGWRWLAIDVVWAIAGGLGIGGVLGTLVGELVLYLRRHHREVVGTDDFLSLGLVSISYGVALLLTTYGFLAVFAAGLALRRIERRDNGEDTPPDVSGAALAGDVEEIATDYEQAPAYMAQAVLGFNEQLERIAVVGVVMLIGTMLGAPYWTSAALWFVPLLFLAIRPVSVWLGLIKAEVTSAQRRYIAWFGIRGIGSVYYLMYAIEHGLPEEYAVLMIAVTFAVIASSIVLHGASVTPLMKLYSRRHEDG